MNISNIDSNFQYFTLKAHFHGGGIYSRHKTLKTALLAQKLWKSEPKLAIARKDIQGKFYISEYYPDGGIAFTQENPVPTLDDRPFPSAYDYYLLQK